MHRTHICLAILYLLVVVGNGCRRAPAELPPTAVPTATATLPELTLTVELPTQVERGARFNVIVRVGNLSADPLENLTVTLPIPTGATVGDAPASATESGATLQWVIPKIQAGATHSELLTFAAPFDAQQIDLPAAQLALDGVMVASAEMQPLTIAGGHLPIDVARAKVGETVSVVGQVTFYADDLFYVADESGGIRVQSPAGAANLAFAVGQMVTVAGEVVANGESVAIALAAETLDATPCADCADLTLQPAAQTWTLGAMAVLTGTVRDVVSVADGEDVTVADEQDELVQVWVADGTGISAENFTVGQQLTIVGVYDEWHGQRAIAPRQTADLTLRFSDTLRLTFDAPASITQDQLLTHTLTLHNASAESRTNLVVSAAVPRLNGDIFAGAVITTSGNGQLGTDGIIYWGVPQLAAQATQTLTYQIQYFEVGVATTEITVRGDDSADNLTLTSTIYVGQPVPIIAIQTGASSPLRGREASVEGIVTHVAPERGGFFLQQSADILVRGMGIFVETIGEPLVAQGDAVQVRGIVRERNSETIIAAQRDGIVVQSSGNLLPEALPVNPDTDDMQAYFEPLEGMLVTLDEPLLVISDTTAAGITPVVYERDGSDALYVMQIVGGDSYVIGDVVAPLRGVVSAEFDQYFILPITEEDSN